MACHIPASKSNTKYCILDQKNKTDCKFRIIIIIHRQIIFLLTTAELTAINALKFTLHIRIYHHIITKYIYVFQTGDDVGERTNNSSSSSNTNIE